MKKLIKLTLGTIGVIVLLLIIDLVCIFTINRPLFAIKNGNIYNGILYNAYDCEEYSILQIKLKGTKYFCSITNKEVDFIKTEVENVSIGITNITTKGATIIIKDTNEVPYTYGAWYKIEKLENDSWNELEANTTNYTFNSIAYLPNKNNEIKFTINWENIYGELPLGSYRIVSEVNGEYISIEFAIAKTS